MKGIDNKLDNKASKIKETMSMTISSELEFRISGKFKEMLSDL